MTSEDIKHQLIIIIDTVKCHSWSVENLTPSCHSWSVENLTPSSVTDGRGLIDLVFFDNARKVCYGPLCLILM